jgi:hybrid polyketide synthase / nonribosomal peptide synthetase ACE1
LESFDPSTSRDALTNGRDHHYENVVNGTVNGETNDRSPLTQVITPFVFSAASEAALKRNLTAIRDYLTECLGVDIADLAWTLRARRSALPVKVAIAASSVADLVERVSQRLEANESNPSSTIGTRSAMVSGGAKILGVFTGQGAQWAT